MVKANKEAPIHILNVGTKILTRDVMDQCLRTLGSVKTFYAGKLSFAIESIKEKKPHVIICEESFPEGNAIDLIEAIGGLSTSRDLYFALAVQESNESIMSLAAELGVNEILAKPFNATNVHTIVHRYVENRDAKKEAWQEKLCAARKLWDEKRAIEAEEAFREVYKEFPSQGSIVLELAEISLGRGQCEYAINLLKKLLEEQPHRARILHQLGLAYLQSGKPKEAVEVFEKAKWISPNNTRRYSLLADAHLAIADIELQEGLKIESDNTQFILQKLRFLLARKDYLSVINFADNRRPFLSEIGKRDADSMALLAKKMGGFKI